jgi:hypothetical protein
LPSTAEAVAWGLLRLLFLRIGSVSADADRLLLLFAVRLEANAFISTNIGAGASSQFANPEGRAAISRICSPQSQ